LRFAGFAVEPARVLDFDWDFRAKGVSFASCVE
jgi:hypothetical protein